jgi:hypothetical protein
METEMKDINSFVGKRVRAYDFEPSPGRTDRYVEGTVTSIDELRGLLVIKVEVDTCHDRARIVIQTPPPGSMIMDWENRVTIIEQSIPRYNQEFDREHYPQKPHQIVSIGKIAVHFGLEAIELNKWIYDATIHGVIFTLNFCETILRPVEYRGRERLDKEALEFLLTLPNFRWIESAGGVLQIALSHTKEGI